MTALGFRPTTIETPARPLASEALLVSGCLIAFGAFLFSPYVLTDGDTLWHIATGQWMLQHLRVPHADPFSIPHFGQRWVAHEWLSELLMGGGYRLLGWTGVLLVYGAAYSLAVGAVIQHVGRYLGARGVAFVLLLLVLSSLRYMVARPLILALPMMVLWLLGLMRARAEGRAPGLRQALLMILWANLHGSFVLGFVLAAAFAAEALLADWRRPWAAARDWGLFALVSLAAGAATPHGVEGYFYPFEILRMKALSSIVEWRPEDFSHLTLFQAVFFAGLFACLARGVRVPPVRAALLLLLLYMALKQLRQDIVLGFLAPLLLAEPFANAAGDQKRRELTPPGFALVLTIGVALMTLARLGMPTLLPDSTTKPISAMRHVPPSLAAQPVLNAYEFGGYLIFNGLRPFIDGRSDMYGDAFYGRYARIADGDQSAFDAAVRRYGIRWTLLSPASATALKLDQRAGWRRLYGDKWAVVHVRAETPRS